MANSPPIQPHQLAPTDPNLQIEHHEYVDPFRDIFSDPKAQAALDAIDHVHRAIDDELPDAAML